MAHPTFSLAETPVVILAGGRGTRLIEETRVTPKPMVLIGEKPILLHIMSYYHSFGFQRFIVCLGYKGYLIKDFFLNLHKHGSDLTVYGGRSEHKYTISEAFDWQVDLVETGEHSLTATRIHRARKYIDAPHFCLTYGDGLSDIAVDKEIEFHLSHGKMATVAAVHPPSRFGSLGIDGQGRVTEFKEKSKLVNDYINGGFFIFRSEFLSRLSSTENQTLEGDVLSKLARDKELYCFKHEGYWQCMDTLRDRDTLEEAYQSGKAPWVLQ